MMAWFHHMMLARKMLKKCLNIAVAFAIYRTTIYIAKVSEFLSIIALANITIV